MIDATMVRIDPANDLDFRVFPDGMAVPPGDPEDARRREYVLCSLAGL